MTEQEMVFIQRACERLVYDFAFYSDRQNYQALAGLFTEDGRMTRPSGDLLVGRAAILQSYQSRPSGRTTRHNCTNVRIDVESPDRARGVTYALVYSANANAAPEAHFGIKADARQLIGEFEDEFVRTREGWRFAVRRACFVMHVQ
jgi:hypothetical protein